MPQRCRALVRTQILVPALGLSLVAGVASSATSADVGTTRLDRAAAAAAPLAGATAGGAAVSPLAQVLPDGAVTEAPAAAASPGGTAAATASTSSPVTIVTAAASSGPAATTAASTAATQAAAGAPAPALATATPAPAVTVLGDLTTAEVTAAAVTAAGTKPFMGAGAGQRRERTATTAPIPPSTPTASATPTRTVTSGPSQSPTPSPSQSATAAPTTAVGAPVPAPRLTGQWRLAYADDFNGTSLDPKVWMRLRGTGAGYRWPYNVDLDASAFDPGYSSVENGNLKIRWAPSPITDGGVTFPYRAGIATTATGYSFQYGVVEARIWVPRASGIAPAFWMLPTPVDSTWPPEVDIAELSTTPAGQVDAHFNVHYTRNGVNGQIAGFPQYGTDVGGSWHTYTLVWQPTSMTVYLDGAQAYQYTGVGIPQQPMYVIFSGGVLKGSDPGAGEMLVDYLRVWQQ